MRYLIGMPKSSKNAHSNRAKAKDGQKPTRNGALYDKWTNVHLLTGVLMGWSMSPFIALSIMVIWEPVEIFIISPIVARWGIVFGYESIQNSLSDIVADTIGVSIGAYILAVHAPLWFKIFG